MKRFEDSSTFEAWKGSWKYQGAKVEEIQAER
jgi:hypothetical protein